MKFQITKKAFGQSIDMGIVEAKSKAAAIKSLCTSEVTIGLRKDGTYTVGANRNQYKAVYSFNRMTFTVTPVIEANVPAIMMPIGW